ncbi:MAG: hypothetical protein CL840_04555 [Crocinitomicaceae bacterium]|nr:hypothetical protein [Crocinitomicaceae bacterium]
MNYITGFGILVLLANCQKKQGSIKMTRKALDDKHVIYSPTRGFWGDEGWSWSLHKADTFSHDTRLILGFKPDVKARRILLSHCEMMDKYELGVLIMQLAVSRLLKNGVPPALKSLLAGASSKSGKIYINDGKSITGPMEPSEAQMQLGIRYFQYDPTVEDVVELANKILHVNVGMDEYENIYIVKPGGEMPYEKAPVVPPFNPTYKLTEHHIQRRREVKLAKKTNQ